MAPPDDLAVVIAVLTYRRTAELGGALTGLLDHVADSGHEAAVLVVDNDEVPSAADVVAGFPGVRYVHEPRPGIAMARNRAIAESAEFRVLIFIDDDELPQPGWLAAMLGTWERERSAGVVGAVVSEFTAPLDPWIEAGRFFRRRRLPTGTEVDVAATNNLLLDLDVVRRLGVVFDDRFGISGGSDTLFTRQLVAAGERLVWCDEAVVVDIVPPDRITRDWVLRRAERSGNSWSRTSVTLAAPGRDRLWQRTKLIGRALVRLVGGGGRAAIGRLARSDAQHARGRRTAARGRGMLAGALGSVVVEYARPAPDSAATP